MPQIATHPLKWGGFLVTSTTQKLLCKVPTHGENYANIKHNSRNKKITKAYFDVLLLFMQFKFIPSHSLTHKQKLQNSLIILTTFQLKINI